MMRKTSGGEAGVVTADQNMKFLVSPVSIDFTQTELEDLCRLLELTF